MPGGSRDCAAQTDDAGQGTDDQQRHRPDPAQMREELMAVTKLTPKGRSSISPMDVKMDTGVGANEIRFFFPKTDLISLDDKEVVFETSMRAIKITQKFHPKEMTYKGKLEL